MSLSPTDLQAAMSDAVKLSGTCLKWCMTGIESVENGLSCWHNGLGTSDSQEVHVYAKHVLEASTEKLTLILADWITALHKRDRTFDLNEVPK